MFKGNYDSLHFQENDTAEYNRQEYIIHDGNIDRYNVDEYANMNKPIVIRHSKYENIMIQHLAAETIQEAFKRYQECKKAKKILRSANINKMINHMAAETIQTNFRKLLMRSKRLKQSADSIESKEEDEKILNAITKPNKEISSLSINKFTIDEKEESSNKSQIIKSSPRVLSRNNSSHSIKTITSISSNKSKSKTFSRQTILPKSKLFVIDYAFSKVFKAANLLINLRYDEIELLLDAIEYRDAQIVSKCVDDSYNSIDKSINLPISNSILFASTLSNYLRNICNSENLLSITKEQSNIAIREMKLLFQGNWKESIRKYLLNIQESPRKWNSITLTNWLYELEILTSTDGNENINLLRNMNVLEISTQVINEVYGKQSSVMNKRFKLHQQLLQLLDNWWDIGIHPNEKLTSSILAKLSMNHILPTSKSQSLKTIVLSDWGKVSVNNSSSISHDDETTLVQIASFEVLMDRFLPLKRAYGWDISMDNLSSIASLISNKLAKIINSKANDDYKGCRWVEVQDISLPLDSCYHPIINTSNLTSLVLVPLLCMRRVKIDINIEDTQSTCNIEFSKGMEVQLLPFKQLHRLFHSKYEWWDCPSDDIIRSISGCRGEVISLNELISKQCVGVLIKSKNFIDAIPIQGLLVCAKEGEVVHLKKKTSTGGNIANTATVSRDGTHTFKKTSKKTSKRFNMTSNSSLPNQSKSISEDDETIFNLEDSDILNCRLSISDDIDDDSKDQNRTYMSTPTKTPHGSTRSPEKWFRLTLSPEHRLTQPQSNLNLNDSHQSSVWENLHGYEAMIGDSISIRSDHSYASNDIESQHLTHTWLNPKVLNMNFQSKIIQASPITKKVEQTLANSILKNNVASSKIFASPKKSKVNPDEFEFIVSGRSLSKNTSLESDNDRWADVKPNLFSRSSPMRPRTAHVTTQITPSKTLRIPISSTQSTPIRPKTGRNNSNNSYQSNKTIRPKSASISKRFANDSLYADLNHIPDHFNDEQARVYRQEISKALNEVYKLK